MPVDFGKTAHDYARYRTDFPPELLTRLAEQGIGLPGHHIVDVGTGTGTLARSLATRGCAVTGIDVAPDMLDQARQQDTEHGVRVTYRVAHAEDTGLPAHQWHAVTAGQCWHWLDRPRAAAEAHRLLTPDGALVICYRDYAAPPGSIGATSEQLVLKYNPNWPLAGGIDNHPHWYTELAVAGFRHVDTLSFEVPVPFTHEAWRGRMRSSNGVGASLSPAEVTAFDAELAQLLRDRFPQEPLSVPHRIWAIVARTTTHFGQH